MREVPNGETLMTGRCLCGSVTYQVTSEPIGTGICHCNHCQPQAGTAFSVVMILPRASVIIDGHTEIFNDVGASGKAVQRRYCGKCGSPLTTESDFVPEGLFLKTGTLDDTSAIKPTFEMFVGRRQAWLKPFPGMDQLPGNPQL